jgi:uncharacterized protein
MKSEIDTDISRHPQESAQSPPLGPVGEQERVATLDVLRGFAIFGVLLANILFFAFGSQPGNLLSEGASSVDKLMPLLIAIFVEGKFYVLFALLFGMGLALQSSRAERSGRPFTGIYIRRLLVLVFFGIAHGLLFSAVDILSFYAIIAIIALPFRNVRPKALLGTAIALFTIGLLLMGSHAVLNPAAPIPSEPDWQELLDNQRSRREIAYATPINEYVSEENPTSVQVSLVSTLFELLPLSKLKFYEFMADEKRIFSEGKWTEMIRHRAATYFLVTMPLKLLFVSWRVLALFILGIYFVKRSIFLETRQKLRLYKKMVISGLAFGMILQFAGGAAQIAMGSNILILCVFLIGIFVGTFWLGLAYAGTVALICAKPGRSIVVGSLAAVGRTALTNYLGQSVICGLLFYSYGLGLFGQLKPAHAVLLVIPIFSFQLFISSIWLRFFRFGPMEWVWRSLSYWKLQPMNRTS